MIQNPIVQKCVPFSASVCIVRSLPVYLPAMTSSSQKCAFQTPLGILPAFQFSVSSSFSSKLSCPIIFSPRKHRVHHHIQASSLDGSEPSSYDINTSNGSAAHSNVQQNIVPSSSHRVLSVQTSRRSHPVIHIASARAITPFRRRREHGAHFTEEPSLPSQRRTDLMAPKSTGIWSLLPYVAASAVMLGVGWLGKKRFSARQSRLVEEFGEVIVLYGSSPDAKREIASEYKNKVGPGLLRGAMFSSYLRALVSEKPIVPSSIQDVSLVKRLLGLSDDRAVKAINALGKDLKDSPSLLGKLLFLADRVIKPEKLQGLSLVSLFPYSPPTVSDLQRNMLERCFKEYVSDEIDVNGIEETPMAAASALRLDPADAQSLFDSVVLARLRKKEAKEAALAAAAAEEAPKPDDVRELDYPARSGEPAKANVHAYQCSDCGYTLFPAAGREFKFYGDDFVCPACGAPKDKFVDLNAEE